MLVTTRETRRWVIPKGWPMKRLPDRKAAAREAKEEAGVKGHVRRKPIGTYSYFKRRETEFEFIEVTVYLLVVEQVMKEWPEMDQRQRRWFSIEDAEREVGEPGLKALILSLSTSKAL